MNPAQSRLLIASFPAALAAGAGVWALRTFDPNLPGNPFPPCVFLTVTGHYCAGCGITRMLHALVHGDLATAVQMNVLAMFLLAISPFTVAWLAGWKPGYLRPAARMMSSPWFWAVLLIGFWIARNLPWYPFTLLAPG